MAAKSKGKWAALHPPETPAVEAARDLLAARLRSVQKALEPAAERALLNVEYVHQLRVATRRAAAGLRVFDAFVPTKDARRVKATLRSLRRAAGDARDWDVFAAGLDDSPALTAAPAAKDYLLGYANGQRAVAQLFLGAAAEEQAEGLAKQVERLPQNVSDDEATGLGYLARTAMAALFADLQALLTAGPKSPGELHQLRIQCKRTRYAMEVFAGCYQPAFREVIYPAIEDVQGILGTVQDGYVLSARLVEIRIWLRATRREALERFRPGFDELGRETTQKVRTARTQFRRWTRDWAKLNAAHPLAELSL